jgi:hypothetical protein
LEAEITEKADELTALKTLHEQQRNEEKQFDKQEVEKEEKLKQFNEEAARIAEKYNTPNADRVKFETRMGEKEAELNSISIKCVVIFDNSSGLFVELFQFFFFLNFLLIELLLFVSLLLVKSLKSSQFICLFCDFSFQLFGSFEFLSH